MLHFVFVVCFWAIVLSFLALKIMRSSQKAFAYLKKLHQIPCSKCVYFTGKHYLKCSLNPKIALTEEAIDCQDFEPNFTSERRSP
ncbi:hypothetical protein [Myxosarcina sp. GI1(2024)]